jgi:hypothetical protein
VSTVAAQPAVGFSTGAVARGDVDAGVSVSLAFDRPVVELSALAEPELDSVVAVLGTPAVAPFSRVSVHGPVKQREMAEADLVRRLAALDVDVVMHPDVFDDIDAWAALGARLLVENNDSRKRVGSGAADLERFFERLPDARFCLDVSHALDAGGRDLVVDLARRFGDRTVQLHVGCGCGHDVGVGFDGELCAAMLDCFDTLGAPRPVILERSTPASNSDALWAQVDAVSSAVEC